MGELVEHFGHQLRALSDALARVSNVDQQRLWVGELLSEASLESAVLAPFVEQFAPSLGERMARSLSLHEQMLGLFERQDATPLGEWLREAGGALEAHRVALERGLLPALEQALTELQRRSLCSQLQGWRARQRPVP